MARKRYKPEEIVGKLTVTCPPAGGDQRGGIFCSRPLLELANTGERPPHRATHSAYSRWSALLTHTVVFGDPKGRSRFLEWKSPQQWVGLHHRNIWDV